jgi:hypothetical protein
MQQLDLLNYVPSAQEMAIAYDLEPPKNINHHVVAHWQRCADVYLSLMGRIARGDRLPQNVKRHEIGRLMAMRETALQRAREGKCN